MPVLRDLNNIKLIGDPVKSGHQVYKATLNDSEESIIYKLNKHGKPLLSQMEVAFTGLARLFLKPGLTSQQELVGNSTENEITGVMCKHFCYDANGRELKNAIKQNRPLSFFRRAYINGDNEVAYPRLTKPSDPNEPILLGESDIYFFKDFPAGFFARLVKDRNRGKIVFDWASLASILTSAYTLQEDDFHKGNLGFYVTEDENNIPKIVFFKIDHDLMMCDSLMSRISRRPTNLFYGSHAYDITKRDVKQNPKLLDSKNHYWPTIKRHFSTSSSSTRIYKDNEEIQAFIDIGKEPAFKKEKWLCFYKHILIPEQLIRQSLKAAFPHQNGTVEEQAFNAMITDAVVARQAHLRSVLFSSGEFRKVLRSMTDDEMKDIINEIVTDNCDKEKAVLLNQMREHLILLAKHNPDNINFSKQDNPLHAAIRLGNFRYNETWHSFSSFAEQLNASGEKPLDVAVKMLKQFDWQKEDPDPASNPVYITQFLLKNGVKETQSYNDLSPDLKKQIATYKPHSIHRKNAESAITAPQLIDIIQRAGEDNRYSLKMKKDIAIDCLKVFIQKNREKPSFAKELIHFKAVLNNKPGYENDAPKMQFIRQLRSSLWIIRQIRGLFGRSSSLSEMNSIIDYSISKSPQKSNCCSFFYTQERKNDLPQEPAPTAEIKLISS